MKHFFTLCTSLMLIGVAVAGDIKLPSGIILKNAQIGPIKYTTGIPASLALQYEMSESIDSKEVVSKEVADIWTTFRLEAEKAKFTSAVIMVLGPADNVLSAVRRRQQRNFVFEQKDGAWKMGLPSVWQEQKEPLSPTPKPPA